MSRQQPPYGGPRGPWNPRANNPTSPTPSPFQYRPPSPWTPVAPSPPPIISGPRRLSMQSPAPGMMSPTPFSHAMSPGPNAGGMRGSRGSSNMPHPRPQWPQQLASGGPQSFTPPMRGSNQSPAPYQPLAFQPNFYPNQTPPTPPALQSKIGASPTQYGAANGPRPFRSLHAPLQHQNSYGAPTSSFQLSPTPSPIVCQTPNSEFIYSNQRHTPMSHMYEAQQQQQQQQQQRYYPLPQQSPSPSPFQQQQQSQYSRQPSQPQYDYVGVPLEPPQPKSYVIYDDEEEYGPSTAEIIANQSQDYIDEKLAEYQMTILQLQGE